MAVLIPCFRCWHNHPDCFSTIITFTIRGFYQIAVACPASLHSTRKILGLHDNQFDQYVVCPRCNSIYDMEQCIGQTASGSRNIKCCWYVQFPNHPRQRLRTECRMPLLDIVCSRSGSIHFRPPKNILLPITKRIYRIPVPEEIIY